MATREQYEQQLVNQAMKGKIGELALSLGIIPDERQNFVDTVYALAFNSTQKVLMYDAETGTCLTPKVGARGGVDGAGTKIASQNLPGTNPAQVDKWYSDWLCDDKPPVPAASHDIPALTVELSKTDRELLQAIVTNTAGFHVIATPPTGLLGLPISHTGKEK